MSSVRSTVTGGHSVLRDLKSMETCRKAWKLQKHGDFEDWLKSMETQFQAYIHQEKLLFMATEPHFRVVMSSSTEWPVKNSKKQTLR